LITEDVFKNALHTPAHLFRAGATYMITASTYMKLPIMKDHNRKEQWFRAFQKAVDIHEWNIIAWVVLDNHYHTMLKAPYSNAENLPKLISSYHKFSPTME